MYCSTDSMVTDADIDLPLFWRNYTVGKKWNYGERVREVVSINETVTVEAGTFNNCIKIKEYKIDYIEFFVWIRNDIGIIKLEQKNEDWEMELKSKNF